VISVDLFVCCAGLLGLVTGLNTHPTSNMHMMIDNALIYYIYNPGLIWQGWGIARKNLEHAYPLKHVFASTLLFPRTPLFYRHGWSQSPVMKKERGRFWQPPSWISYGMESYASGKHLTPDSASASSPRKLLSCTDSFCIRVTR